VLTSGVVSIHKQAEAAITALFVCMDHLFHLSYHSVKRGLYGFTEQTPEVSGQLIGHGSVLTYRYLRKATSSSQHAREEHIESCPGHIGYQL
jgi:hypothetical protein